MPKKGEVRKWAAEDMKKAIQAVRDNEMEILLASKLFNVPHTTLQRMSRSEKSIDELLATKLGRPPTLTKSMEDDLVKYLLEMESRYWGLTRADIRSLAFQIANMNNIPNRF